MALFIFLMVIAYLMGSFSSAIIVCKLFALPDPRQEGSGNPGATNVLRYAGKSYAALVMLGDILKGTIPVLIAKALDADAITIGFTALAAVVGHIYPLFFNFKGGKGVATAIGALLGFHFIVGIMVAATWILIANFTRYSSLASITAITLSPFYTLLLTGQLDTFPPLFIMVLLILYKHKSNISRLMDGVEPKIKLRQGVIHDIMEMTHNEMTGEKKIEIPTELMSVTKKKAAPQKEPVKAAKTTKTTAKKPSKTSETAAKKPKSTTAKPKKTKG